MPSYYSFNWYEIFISKLSNNIAMVGSSINLLPEDALILIILRKSLALIRHIFMSKQLLMPYPMRAIEFYQRKVFLIQTNLKKE